MGRPKKLRRSYEGRCGSLRGAAIAARRCDRCGSDKKCHGVKAAMAQAAVVPAVVAARGERLATKAQ